MVLPKNAKYLDLQQTGCTVFFVERKLVLNYVISAKKAV